MLLIMSSLGGYREKLRLTGAETELFSRDFGVNSISFGAFEGG